MLKRLTIPLVALAALLMLVPAALAQSTMIRGHVVDPEGKPVVGAVVLIEFKGGVARKYQTKTDRRGEFVQLLTESGDYQVTVTADKVGSQSAPVRVRLGQPADVNITLSAEGGLDPKAAEVKKAFDEGVAASRAGDHDTAIARFTDVAAMMPGCHDCYYNIGVSYLQKNDEKQAEEAWKKAIELKPDYAEALSALATLYNNQKRFDEAAAMSAKAAAAGGSTSSSADVIYNQGIILWNQGKIAEAKAKFEETVAADATYADAHFQLGMALLNEGKLPEAVGAFETYLKLAPTGQFAAQATAMVAQLKK
ncbi:MAG TPA: tetratricopeptide repeat protein [Vicinamibacterales bacterium]|nr:tetratricopeptide repeat protein [Vicinamibacterales bacterium]